MLFGTSHVAHILQGYFTGIGADDCPSASEVTLKEMGKYTYVNPSG